MSLLRTSFYAAQVGAFRMNHQYSSISWLQLLLLLLHLCIAVFLQHAVVCYLTKRTDMLKANYEGKANKLIDKLVVKVTLKLQNASVDVSSLRVDVCNMG